MLDIKKDVLFVGTQGSSAVFWYRCALPAMTLGCDYVGLAGEPPEAIYATGIVRGESKRPNFLDYKVVVLQQPHGPGWLKIIRELRAKGIVVLFEVDDWLHAIQHQRDHDFREDFDKTSMIDFEKCMKACDGMIVSTDFLRSIYRSFNRNIEVCENGVDVSRYDLKKPGRRTVNIGWAGATGHRQAITPWLQAVAKVMQKRDQVNFTSIGQPYATAFHGHFPEERATPVPFCALEQYPAAMTAIDIAIAPASNTGFYRGKSDLRWLEAGALGIPIVAHPLVYPKIEPGVTGFHATGPREVERTLLDLVDNQITRLAVGDNARRYVRRERSAEAVSTRWADVLQASWANRVRQ